MKNISDEKSDPNFRTKHSVVFMLTTLKWKSQFFHLKMFKDRKR